MCHPLLRRVVLVLALSTYFAAPVPAAAQDCAVSRIDGSPVSLWNAGRWRDAAAGPLSDGDAKLRTGPDARAEMRCATGLVVTVGASTEVSIESLVTPEPGVILQILEGIVGLVAPGPRRGRTELRGPLAIASARSTEWLMTVGPDRATAVFVRAGTVAVDPLAATGPPRRLGAGEGIDIRPGEPPDPPHRWSAARIAASGAALGFGWR